LQKRRSRDPCCLICQKRGCAGKCTFYPAKYGFFISKITFKMLKTLAKKSSIYISTLYVFMHSFVKTKKLGLHKKDKKRRENLFNNRILSFLHRPYKIHFYLLHMHVGHRDVHTIFLITFFLTFSNILKMHII
jgi:hypothetical protein